MPDSTTPPPADLYQRDFAAWVARQVRLLRAADDSGLDRDHVAEELEGLANSERRELGSRIAAIVEHLLKLQYAASVAPRAGWIDTINRSRDDIQRLLEDSPSLSGEVDARIARELPRAIRAAERALSRYGDAVAAAAPRDLRFTRDQVLGDWFPGDGAPASRPV